jgi:hypothetical protein
MDNVRLLLHHLRLAILRLRLDILRLRLAILSLRIDNILLRGFIIRLSRVLLILHWLLRLVLHFD